MGPSSVPLSPGLRSLAAGPAPARGGEARSFYDIKTRAENAGRDPDHVKIMPGVFPVIGRAEAEATGHCPICRWWERRSRSPTN